MDHLKCNKYEGFDQYAYSFRPAGLITADVPLWGVHEQRHWIGFHQVDREGYDTPRNLDR